ncbi:nitrogen regulation protein NR(I) [Aliidiomarina celeris]|uniref:nitrogen regulation protein NR(I) n=1 Tax=Aliidiomarina celeris TaxID=2249428 RepID=UPI000DE93F47|nr:nitrogen regulation protein NR(I) [Aliidiomarina celeris]
MKDLVWVLDDDDSIRWVLERAFHAANWRPELFANANDLLTALAHASTLPAVIFTDVRMPGMNGMELLERVQRDYAGIPVVIMTAHSDLDSAVKAFKGGAFEYLPKPFDLDDVIAVAERAIKKGEAEQGSEINHKRPTIIGEAPAMQEVFRAIGRLSRSSVSVLLTGSSGTGKELVAKALHEHSDRANGPFVALNMAAIPEDLIESELFGHEKGAFTGALQRRDGRFRQAHGGTLFLDEIGDMPLAVQTRLLRVLAEGQFYPVGSHELVSVNVRVIAATHIDLSQAVEEKRFREDLYHRLNVIHVRLPTLAERRTDIPALAHYFLARAANELQMPEKRLTPAAYEMLQNAPWPGNVRQLENTCRWITVMASSDWVDVDELPNDLTPEHGGQFHTQGWQAYLRSAFAQALENGKCSEMFVEIENLAIQEALKVTNGHKQQAAERLGWGRNTLTRKLKRKENGKLL